MKQNLVGLLGNGARLLRETSPESFEAGWWAGGLEELLKHLKELRDRHRAGDMAVVDEFFALYVFGDESPSKVES